MGPQGRNRSGHWQLWLPGTLILLLGMVGILAHSQIRLATLQRQQADLAHQAVTLASREIGLVLQNQRHLLTLFNKEHEPSLRRALADPGSNQAQAELRELVQSYFPGAFAHTLVSQDGLVLLEDFEGLVGENCRRNIQEFARTSDQHLVLHPNPIKPHYDVMARFDQHVFFVSFEPTGISQVLASHEIPGLRLLLLRHDSLQVEWPRHDPARLAIQTDAARPSSPEDMLLASAGVPNTEWRVSALPTPESGSLYRGTLWRESMVLLAVLALFAFGFQSLLAREDRKRRRAEAEAREMADLGFLDSLTGLPNRRALDEGLAREWLNVERSDEPLSLLMIDLDRFKEFNDTYGHLAGDRCLRTVAQTMRGALRRPRDQIARFGGEEFAILLPNTPCLAAKLLADALHESVGESFANQKDPGVTVSIGISCAHAGQLRSAHELLDLADQALYGAKGAGRNTTVIIPAGP